MLPMNRTRPPFLVTEIANDLPFDCRAVEQIVGRERRGRLSQLSWWGGGWFVLGPRVNSDVRRFYLIMKKTSDELQIVTGIAWYRPEQWETASRSFRRCRQLGGNI